MVNTQEMMFNLVIIIVVVVPSPSHVQFFATPSFAAFQVSLIVTTYQTLTKFMAIESVMPFNHVILCNSLLLPSIFLSIRVFPKSQLFSSSGQSIGASATYGISPSKEHSVLISIKIDWFDLFTFQGILKSLTQHHSSKASILWCSAFFMVKLSHPYMITGKTI